MRLLLLLLLFALSVKGEAAFEKQEEYCSHDKPLATDHVLSTYEKNIPVKGCVSVESDSTSGHQVVLIRTDSSDVSLSLTGKTHCNELLTNHYYATIFRFRYQCRRGHNSP